MRYFSTCHVFKLQWLAILIAGATGPAVAEVPPPEANRNTPEAVAPPWELYDTNEDGYISTDEAAAQGMSARTFKGLDIDRDGRLNRDEFAKAPRIRLK
ncbi:EF-hand domain-containing protein [Nitrosospira sp. Nsp1]|uniref:EF-hand domain-containing protein n=1 Tax=Nitrosospira sp. Nsp1 TaxID=136547 RepID=UPI00088A8DC5|nr:EF-hand domain-containing protein [Nitrosospira sp. Nsp1]SCX45003.1 EF hand [Nitrosospira sp. Nsp1]